MNRAMFQQGGLYKLVTMSRPEGFIFQPLSIGSKGMTGYIDGGTSWPRTVEFSEIVSAVRS